MDMTIFFFSVFCLLRIWNLSLRVRVCFSFRLLDAMHLNDLDLCLDLLLLFSFPLTFFGLFVSSSLLDYLSLFIFCPFFCLFFFSCSNFFIFPS